MTIKEEYQSFESIISEGVDIQHSGQDLITVTTVKEYYEADEVACEESWADYHSDCDVSVEDILNNAVSLDDYEFSQVLNSYVNGQFKQCFEQFENLDDHDAFMDWLDNDRDYKLNILELIVRRTY